MAVTRRYGRTTASLLAGAAAITLNTAAVAAADLVPLATAHGGLLRFLVQQTGVAAPAVPAFGVGFHVAIGLAMALAYGFALEPWLPGPPWWCGVIYAVAV